MFSVGIQLGEAVVRLAIASDKYSIGSISKAPRHTESSGNRTTVINCDKTRDGFVS